MFDKTNSGNFLASSTVNRIGKGHGAWGMARKTRGPALCSMRFALSCKAVRSIRHRSEQALRETGFFAGE
jgi:hypothetical protein